MNRKTLHLSLSASLALVAPATAQQFTVAALPGTNIWTDGVAFADVDGDGDQDVLFANGSTYGSGGAQPQHLFLNDGSGNLTAAHAQLNVANFNAKMVIAHDFDNDGDPDLMYAAEGPFPAVTQKPRMLINDGTGVFSDQSATRLPNINMASFCVCAGDVDNDRDLDVVFTDGATFSGVASQARLYLNDGNGFFTDATATHMPADLYNAQDVTLFDWDGDADVDIGLSGKGGTGKRSRLYLNDGTGHFSISNILNALGSSATYEIDFAELDGDGDLDCLVQSISGSSEGWARNDITAVMNFTFPTPNGNDDNEMAAMDFDSDGDLDVFVGSLASTEKVYRNNGNGTFTYATTGVIPAQADSTLDFGFTDLNGDGRYDMVTGQGESGNFTDKVYTNTGTPDTLPPTLVRSHTPSAIGASGTSFHITLRDAIQDDGVVNVTTTFDWAVTNNNRTVTTGSGVGFHMGGGLFSAQVPTSASSVAASVIWHATDSSGNSTDFGPVGVGSGWFDLGFAKPGANGLPVLSGTGVLAPGSGGSLSLTNAAPSSTAALFIGLTRLDGALLGGTLVPFPDVAVFLTTSPAGTLAFNFTWPAGLPAGTPVYLQYVIADAGGQFGTAMSNALQGVSQ